jgi:hypothetical protein
MMDLFKFFRKKDPETSEQAAESIGLDLPVIQAQVYAYAKYRGEQGFTDDEMNEFFQTTKSTYRSRRATLVQKGYIVDSGTRVFNDSNRSVIVWRTK